MCLPLHTLETRPARVTFAPDVVSENQLPFYYPKVLYCIVLLRVDAMRLLNNDFWAPLRFAHTV